MSRAKKERAEEIKRLRFTEHWTLPMIAKFFSITKQRVQQILGSTGNYHHAELHDKLISVSRHPELTNGQLAEKLKVSRSTVTKYRFGSRHAIKGGPVKIGVEVEEYVSSKLNSLGIKHKPMPHNAPFDIQLENGVKVDVKSSNPQSSLSKVSKMYSFRTGQEKRGNYADFFICVTCDTKEIFIIPASETRRNATPIRFTFPESNHGMKSKWLKYHNRFDLLITA